MRILVSPSKTKKLKGIATIELFSESLTGRILQSVKRLSAESLGKLLKLKTDKAAQLQTFYEQFETMPEGAAGESYTGLAFKNLDWSTLSTEDKKYGEAHLIILSALYGMATPNSPIKEYRLDLVDPILRNEGTTLYEVWRKSVNDALQREDWLLNLASKEYSSLIEHPRLITILFTEEKNGKTVQLSTTSKQLRGRMARYVIVHRISEPENLPDEFEGFLKQSTSENQHCITYHKE